MTAARRRYLERVLDGRVTGYTPEEEREAIAMWQDEHGVPEAVWLHEPQHRLLLRAEARRAGAD